MISRDNSNIKIRLFQTMVNSRTSVIRLLIPFIFLILILTYTQLTYLQFLYFSHRFDVLSNNSQAIVLPMLMVDSNISETKYKIDFLNSSKQMTILFGSPWWHTHYPFLSETKWMCPKCNFIEDNEKFEISDLVVFHGSTINREPPVGRRGKNQIWVYLTYEAPDYLGSSVEYTKNYTDMFNWTMTYRHDSDIQVPYGRFVPLRTIPLPKYEETWAFLPSALVNKSRIYDESFMRTPTLEELKNRRMVAWIVSHCETRGKRELVVKELSKYIPIDTYGDCGNFTCNVPKSKSMSGIDCHFQISRQYKFYLSFENSLCEDYVTEKYFDILYTQMIPIVYGNANYTKISPKNSYINVEDFTSLKELAFYLKYLDSNPQEYLKYFEWRKNYWVQNNRFVTGYCDLCKKLWNHDHTIPKFYHNLTEWWYHRSDFKTSGLNACVVAKKIYARKS